LNFLSIALGSCGEFHSSYDSCKQAGQIKEQEYKAIEQLHYKVENELLKLIASLKRKTREGEWVEDLLKE
jgi:four helix bundle protein